MKIKRKRILVYFIDETKGMVLFTTGFETYKWYCEEMI